MPNKRIGYAPWRLTREAGVQSATVEGTIEVPQNVQPTLSTGFVDERGNWQGEKSNDEVFIGLTKAVEVVNGGEVLFPDTSNHRKIDMTGYKNIFIAYKPTRGGNIKQEAVMGPNTLPFANLSPVNAASALRGLTDPTIASFGQALFEASESLTADVWNIFYIGLDRLADQKNMQFLITNNSGGASTIEFAYMRLV